MPWRHYSSALAAQAAKRWRNTIHLLKLIRRKSTRLGSRFLPLRACWQGPNHHAPNLGVLVLACMTSRRAPFGYTANADTVLIARKERNACTNQRVADGRKNSIPRFDSPFQVISNG